MAISSAGFTDALVEAGISVVAGVPCSILADAQTALEAAPSVKYIAAANEGAALGIACGAYLAGNRSAVLMQDSGLGNVVNPLTSLALTYRLGCLLVVSRHHAETDEPQHRVMATLIDPLLNQLGIRILDLGRSDWNRHEVTTAVAEEISARRVMAITVPRGAIVSSPKPSGLPGLTLRAAPRLSQTSAIRAVSSSLPPGTPVVASTGHIARTLFAGHHSDHNFYMVGSMGHAAAIALGLAESQPESGPIVVLDGDGALVMHLGILSTIGSRRNASIIHVVIDNEAYESTGGQRTTANTTSFAAAAMACGYQSGCECHDSMALREAVRRALATRGSHMIVAKVECSASEPPSIMASRAPEDLAAGFRRSFSSLRHG